MVILVLCFSKLLCKVTHFISKNNIKPLFNYILITKHDITCIPQRNILYNTFYQKTAFKLQLNEKKNDIAYILQRYFLYNTFYQQTVNLITRQSTKKSHYFIEFLPLSWSQDLPYILNLLKIKSPKICKLSRLFGSYILNLFKIKVTNTVFFVTLQN